MESGAIPDSNITASTIKTGFEAWKARLNKNFCWMPEVDADTEFIEVTFASIKTVTAIASQGASNDECWVTTFTLRWYNNSAFINGLQVTKYQERLLCLAYNCYYYTL